MKWRTTAVYFLVLLLIGGIYLLLDTKKKQAAREENESRRVFAFDAGAVKEIEIKSGETKAIRLEKGEKWRISEPIASDVDSGEFAGFFSALQHIEQERKIGKPSEHPDAFGLDKPSLTVRLLADSDWLELRIGGKNPAETSRYAKAGENGDVFMMSGSTYAALNKGLKDLRRKDLFTWQPDQVKAVDVKWLSGDEFSLDRQGGAKQWKSATRPGLEIKAAKVQNLLDELHWLRAVDFAEKSAMPSSAQVEITLHLKDGQTSELKIADAGQEKKQAIAACSEIEGPVLVPSHILESIPRTLVSLADRSLIPAETADIKEIAWKTGNGAGNLVWMDENTWGDKEGSAAPRAVEKPWAVRGFLACIDNIEYIEAVEPAANPPEEVPNSVRFVDVFGKKSSLTWNALASESTDPVTVWMQRDGAPREVKIKHEDAQRLNESLAQMNASAKPSKKE